ncbi:MAG: J domain-containing protein [Rhodospirillales bacterium]|nr:MAG: J domain-containing protein [Rhodospirillales bacterium]
MSADTFKSCDWPGCPCEGSFRAPHSRQSLRQFRWFCLEHVRQYNASWNYYAGMTESEVEADVRFDTVWQRPSWRLGGHSADAFGSTRIHDGFAFFSESERCETRRPEPDSAEERALLVLDLARPVTVRALKARYKELVKRYHPDANGGDKMAEERFKEIDAAYRTVLNCLTL